MATFSSKVKSAVSKVKSTVSNTASKAVSGVKSTASNLSKQTSALKSKLPASAASANIQPSNYSSSARRGTGYNAQGQAVKSTVALGSSAVKQPLSTKPIGVSYAPVAQRGTAYNSQGQGVASTIRPTSSVASAPQPKSSNSFRSRASSGISAIRTALGDSVGKSDSYASGTSGIGVGAAAVGGYQDSYGGRAGTSNTSYYNGASRSLESQAADTQGTDPFAPLATMAGRENNRAVVSSWDGSKGERDASAAVLEQQRQENQQAKLADQGATDAVTDALVPDEERTERENRMANYDREDERLQSEIEKLTKPSQEYLDAQRDEENLSAEEARIKDGLNESLYEIKGQAIPQGFLTGQGARQVDLANVGLDRVAGQKQTLQQRLANEQQRRQAAMDVVRERQNFSSKRADRERSTYETSRKEKREDDRYNLERADRRADKQEDNRYRTIGDGTMLYDTMTGKVVSENTKNYAPKSPARSSSSNTGGGADSLPRGGDGFVDPYAYANIRASAKSPSEFDRKYGYLVNPVSKAKFGLSGGSTESGA